MSDIGIKKMFYNLKHIKRKEIIPGYYGKFIHGKNITVAFWKIKKGSPIPIHKHIHEQCLIVIKGSFELLIKGKKHVVQKDNVVMIPSNTEHAGKALNSCEIIDVFSPTRREYNNN